MDLIGRTISALGFKDTVIYKGDSNLQEKYDALTKLNEEYPKNEELLNELYIVKKGLAGENEIEYQLKKANIGMYVLRDIKLKHEDLTAQIDYVVITPVFIYYIECKNLIGNITVNEKGDFIREYTFKGKKIKKGIYSPLRQVEAQKEVVRKIWEKETSKLHKLLSSKHFDYYRRVLVVAANQDTILNTNKAPKDIKYKVLRADALVRQIKYDIDHRDDDAYFDTKKGMERLAQSYLNMQVNEKIDYYEYYKNKFINDKKINKEELKEVLTLFRKERSTKLNIPAYYIYTNEELDQIVDLVPQTLDDLKNSKILNTIKLKTHGQEIVDEINKHINN